MIQTTGGEGGIRTLGTFRVHSISNATQSAALSPLRLSSFRKNFCIRQVLFLIFFKIDIFKKIHMT